MKRNERNGFTASVCTLAAVFIMHSAYASESAEIVVSGSIVPAACGLEIEKSSVNIPGISTDMLLQTDESLPTQLKPAYIRMGVRCGSNGAVALSIANETFQTDNGTGEKLYATPMNDKLNTNLMLGWFVLQLENAQIKTEDDTFEKAQFIGALESKGGEGVWSKTITGQPASFLSPTTKFLSWSTDGSTPVSATGFMADLVVTPYVAPYKDIKNNLSSRVEMTGRAVIELSYL